MVVGLRRLASIARKPIRICRSLHHCELCEAHIKLGEAYHDGGYGRRAHASCMQEAKERLNQFVKEVM
jgi:hypothetical protein